MLSCHHQSDASASDSPVSDAILCTLFPQHFAQDMHSHKLLKSWIEMLRDDLQLVSGVP